MGGQSHHTPVPSSMAWDTLLMHACAAHTIMMEPPMLCTRQPRDKRPPPPADGQVVDGRGQGEGLVAKVDTQHGASLQNKHRGEGSADGQPGHRNRVAASTHQQHQQQQQQNAGDRDYQSRSKARLGTNSAAFVCRQWCRKGFRALCGSGLRKPPTLRPIPNRNPTPDITWRERGTSIHPARATWTTG